VTPNPFILSLLAAVAIAATAFAFLRRLPTRRQRALRAVLDAADALEGRLRVARAEIEAVAGDHVADPVRDAMREMLRQRLWLRDHGNTASLEQLSDVRGSIDAARAPIEQQRTPVASARTASG